MLKQTDSKHVTPVMDKHLPPPPGGSRLAGLQGLFFSSCLQGLQLSLQVLIGLWGRQSISSLVFHMTGTATWRKQAGQSPTAREKSCLLLCQQPPKDNSPEPDLPVVPDSALLTENSLLLSPPIALRVLDPAQYRAWQNREEWFKVLNHSQSTPCLQPA